MQIYYRISDNSYQKPKLAGTTKKYCLENFLRAFNANITIIADNCSHSILEILDQMKVNHQITFLGNVGALKLCLELAMDQPDDETIYICEDDYLHKENAQILLEEGINLADYITLYDHPDKYTKYYNFGEITKVIRTPSSHWRYTISTTMTFATKVKTLKEDMELWRKWTSNVFHPNDHEIFKELMCKGKKLITAIPGAACHIDLTFSELIGYNTIEPWAIDLVANHEV